MVECKYRESLPKWLVDAVAQVRRYATESKLPIVVVKEKNKHTKNALVIMTWGDFMEWFGNGNMRTLQEEPSGRTDSVASD